MKIKTWILLFLMTALVSLAAQNISDVNDPVYEDLQIWETRGLIDFLPLLRPYSLQFVEETLNAVVRKGQSTDRALAEKYLRGIDSGLTADPEIYQTATTDFDDVYSISAANLDINTFFTEYISLSASVAALIEDQTAGEGLLPNGQRETADMARDDSVISAGGRDLLYSLSQRSLMSFGNSRVWFNTGLTRTGYGSFFDDSVIISPTADQAGHFSLTYTDSRFRYSGLLMTLTAVEDNRWGDANLETLFSNKFLATREYAMRVFPWAEIGYISTTIWGDRFEPLYLVPFSDLMYSQMITGAQDNSLMGAFLNLQFNNLRWDSLVYVDDASVKDLLTLNFDSKFKVAGQTGVKWAPEKGLIKMLQADYTAVMPYTYSHWIGTNSDTVDSDGETFYSNLWNYAHNGENLATSLDPNSDRLHLKASWNTGSDLTVSTMFQVFRHGNASEDYEGRSGNIFDDGVIFDGAEVINKLFNELNFLNQDVIETTVQTGVELAYEMEMSGHPVTLEGGYTLEYIWNEELVEDADKLNNYLNFGWKLGL